MGKLDILAEVPGVDPALAYERITDFESYPAHSDAVRDVTLVTNDATSITSSWEVSFRRGVLCWTERAELQPDRGLITFSQVDGDVDAFDGFWTVEADTRGAGCRVRFFVEFEVGVPTLDHLLDPIAEEALYENIVSILQGLLGPDAVICSATSSSWTWRS